MSYFLILSVLLSTSMYAKDFGTFSHTFSIQEEDFIVVLQERLSKVQQTENERLELRRTFVKSIEKPKGKLFPQSTNYRVFEFDPTVCIHEDLRDDEGQIIVAKGTKVNPLDTTSLRTDLLFFDADDAKQILWARSKQGLWILTKGEPLTLEKEEHREVYFDQGSYLSNKLGIRALPAKVSQKGKKLKIEEIPCF